MAVADRKGFDLTDLEAVDNRIAEWRCCIGLCCLCRLR
jgi:hypothetical protein